MNLSAEWRFRIKRIGLVDEESNATAFVSISDRLSTELKAAKTQSVWPSILVEPFEFLRKFRLFLRTFMKIIYWETPVTSMSRRTILRRCTTDLILRVQFENSNCVYPNTNCKCYIIRKMKTCSLLRHHTNVQKITTSLHRMEIKVFEIFCFSFGYLFLFVVFFTFKLISFV